MKHHSNSPIQVATAPVSWGVMEETDTSVWPPAAQVMEEIAASGYGGTELGPFAYYPTEALSLRTALAQHDLTSDVGLCTAPLVPARQVVRGTSSLY